MTKKAAEKAVNLATFLEGPGGGTGGEPDVFTEEFPVGELQRFIDAYPATIYRARSRDAIDCMMAGSVLEDTDPRWLKHFYDPTAHNGAHFSDEAQWAAIAAQPICALLGAQSACLEASEFFLGQQVSNPIWATTDTGNDYRWDAALTYYERSFTDPDPLVRRQYRAKMFRSLGHIVHLLQDLSQPSHVRNDAHAGHAISSLVGLEVTGTSALEDWGKKHCSTEDNWHPAVAAMKSFYHPDYSATTARGYFTQLAQWTASNWFSDDTVFGAKWNPSQATTPSPLTVEAPQSFQQDRVWSALGALVSRARLAKANDSWLLGYPIDMGPMPPGPFEWRPEPARYDLDSEDVLTDSAAHLINKGIAQSTALIDYFFRGQLDIECNPELGPGTDLRITNRSQVGGVAQGLSGGTWRFFYESADHSLVDITQYVQLPASGGGIGPGGVLITTPYSGTTAFGLCSRLGNLSSGSLPDSIRVDRHSRIVAVFRGLIGTEMGVAVGTVKPKRVYGYLPTPGAQSWSIAGGDCRGCMDLPLFDAGFVRFMEPETDDTFSRAVIRWWAGGHILAAYNVEPWCACNIGCTEGAQPFAVLSGSVTVDSQHFSFSSDPATYYGDVDITASVAQLPLSSALSVGASVLSINAIPIPGWEWCWTVSEYCCAGASPIFAYGTVSED